MDFEHLFILLLFLFNAKIEACLMTKEEESSHVCVVSRYIT